ncbi:MAG TPA: hypothetical protein VK327_03905, partial [Candidatus Paceibacterota bacterium]|nr:hypothetical protein [Candidatus Paceibacterota bacterium]
RKNQIPSPVFQSPREISAGFDPLQLKHKSVVSQQLAQQIRVKSIVFQMQNSESSVADVIPHNCSSGLDGRQAPLQEISVNKKGRHNPFSGSI